MNSDLVPHPMCQCKDRSQDPVYGAGYRKQGERQAFCAEVEGASHNPRLANEAGFHLRPRMSKCFYHQGWFGPVPPSAWYVHPLAGPCALQDKDMVLPLVLV